MRVKSETRQVLVEKFILIFKVQIIPVYEDESFNIIEDSENIFGFGFMRKWYSNRVNEIFIVKKHNRPDWEGFYELDNNNELLIYEKHCRVIRNVF